MVSKKQKKLTDKDLRDIDKEVFRQKEVDYEQLLVNKDIEITRTKLESLLLKREVLNFKKAHLLEGNKSLLRSIGLRLKLKNEQFGFDPLTGEIKE